MSTKSNYSFAPLSVLYKRGDTVLYREKNSQNKIYTQAEIVEVDGRFIKLNTGGHFEYNTYWYNYDDILISKIRTKQK